MSAAAARWHVRRESTRGESGVVSGLAYGTAARSFGCTLRRSDSSRVMLTLMVVYNYKRMCGECGRVCSKPLVRELKSTFEFRLFPRRPRHRVGPPPRDTQLTGRHTCTCTCDVHVANAPRLPERKRVHAASLPLSSAATRNRLNLPLQPQQSYLRFFFAGKPPPPFPIRLLPFFGLLSSNSSSEECMSESSSLSFWKYIPP